MGPRRGATSNAKIWRCIWNERMPSSWKSLMREVVPLAAHEDGDGVDRQALPDHHPDTSAARVDPGPAVLHLEPEAMVAMIVDAIEGMVGEAVGDQAVAACRLERRTHKLFEGPGSRRFRSPSAIGSHGRRRGACRRDRGPAVGRTWRAYEHLVCCRRLRGWRALRDHIRGLSEADCRRFAGMRSVPIICPTPGCGLRRETRVRLLTPFVRASSGHRRRAARVTCDGGQLFRACRECHGRKVGRTRTATGQAPIREVHRAAVIEHFGVSGRREATDLLNRARQGSETARREVFRIWSKATRKTLRADWRGPAPEKTLAAIVRGLRTRQFICCHWCGLLVAPRTSRPWAFHGRCFTALRHTPEWQRRWKEVVRDPIRLDRVVRDPQTGRWRPRPGHRQSRPLRGAFELLLERRWNRVRPGPTPSPRNLRLGCEAFIRRHAWDQSDLTIAKALKIRRQEVANVRETFEAHAPGPGDAADALRGTDGQRSHGEPVGWQLIFPGLSDRATVVLADRCPLLGHGSDRVALVRALDRLATPRDYIARLTGVPSPTLQEPR